MNRKGFLRTMIKTLKCSEDDYKDKENMLIILRYAEINFVKSTVCTYNPNQYYEDVAIHVPIPLLKAANKHITSFSKLVTSIYKETKEYALNSVIITSEPVENIEIQDEEIMFENAWNPTQEEIKKWAYLNKPAPRQDWELAVAIFENIPMICKFVDDARCKKTSFFLSALYVFTGDIIRSGDSEKFEKLSQLIKTIEETAKSKKLKLWIERSQHIIKHPEQCTYKYWGLGSSYAYE